MPLEELMNANKEFRVTHQDIIKSYKPDHHSLKKHWAIVTCMSQHLVDFIPQALGLTRGDALFIQNAGNTITPYDNSIIRSLAVGIYMVGVKEVAVIGHTNCNMKMDVMAVTEALKKYGLSRDIFRGFDLREWFGMMAGEEINVRQIVDTIKNSPLIPKEIPVYGLILDSATGELKLVYEYHEYMKSESKPEVKANVPAAIRPRETVQPETKHSEVKKLADEPNVGYKSREQRSDKPSRR